MRQGHSLPVEKEVRGLLKDTQQGVQTGRGQRRLSGFSKPTGTIDSPVPVQGTSQKLPEKLPSFLFVNDLTFRSTQTQTPEFLGFVNGHLRNSQCFLVHIVFYGCIKYGLYICLLNNFKLYS